MEKQKCCIEWDPNKDQSLPQHLGKKVNLSCWTGGKLEENDPTKMHTQLLNSSPEHETFKPDPWQVTGETSKKKSAPFKEAQQIQHTVLFFTGEF